MLGRLRQQAPGSWSWTPIMSLPFMRALLACNNCMNGSSLSTTPPLSCPRFQPKKRFHCFTDKHQVSWIKMCEWQVICINIYIYTSSHGRMFEHVIISLLVAKRHDFITVPGDMQGMSNHQLLNCMHCLFKPIHSEEISKCKITMCDSICNLHTSSTQVYTQLVQDNMQST